MSSSSSRLTGGPVELGEGSSRLVRSLSSLAAPAPSGGAGASPRESRRNEARNAMNGHLLEAFSRFFIILGLIVLLLLVAQLGLTIWFWAEFSSFRSDSQTCDEPLEAWGWVLLSSHIYSAVFHKCIKQALGQEEGQPSPNKVKILDAIVAIFGIVWYSVGLAWANAAVTCADTAPAFHHCITVICIFGIAFWILLWCGLVLPAAILLPLVLRGLVTNEQAAAPRGTVSRLRSVPPCEIDPSHPDCCICLSDFAESEDKDVKVTGCGHYYHTQCLENWFKSASTCPLCRADVGAADGAADVAADVLSV